MHFQIHRQGHKGPAGNPVHFLSCTLPSCTPSTPRAGRVYYPFMFIGSTSIQKVCLASGCHGRVRRRGTYIPETPGIPLKVGQEAVPPPV